MGFVTNKWQPVSASPGPTPVVPVRYGIKINDSNQTVEYLYDATGFTPALMNTTTGVLDYGSWANTPLITSNYPAVTVNRNYTTSIDYLLDPNDYTKKVDGTASNITTPAGDVVAVFEGGWLYTYEETVSNVKYIYIIWSNVQYDSNYQCFHRDNHKSFAIGTYLSDSAKTSRSNTTPSTSSFDAAKCIKWAQLNYIYCLMMIITKSVNSYKSNLGLNINSWISGYTTGQFNNKGQFYYGAFPGSTSNGNKAFHIEVPFYNSATANHRVADISASSTNGQSQPYYITANGVKQSYSTFTYRYNSSSKRYAISNYGVPHIFASPQGVFATGLVTNSAKNYPGLETGPKAWYGSNTYTYVTYGYGTYLTFNDTGSNLQMNISHYID